MAYVAAGLNKRHLKTDDPCPPLAKEKLRLYAMRYCPWAERAMIAFSVKEIPHEVVNIHLREKPVWFSQKNPNGAVPVIEQDNKILYESLIVAEYLDDLHPGHQMLSKDPYERAQQKLLLDRLMKLSGALNNAYHGRDDPKAIAAVVDAIKSDEAQLHDDYFGGKSPSWVDYMTWPWKERLGGANLFLEGKIPLAEHPKMLAYIARMKARPEIQRVMKSDEAHAAVMHSTFVDGKPNYDFECE